MAIKIRQNHKQKAAKAVGKVVNVATFGLLVISGAFIADDIFRMNQDSVMFDELISEQAEKQARIEEYRVAGHDLEAKIAAYRGRMITEDQVSTVQDQLNELANEHKCNLRKSTAKGRREQPLFDRDSATTAETILEKERTALCLLEEETLTLNVEGTLEQLLHFLAAVERKNWMYSTNEIVLQKEADENDLINMNVDFVFYNIIENKKREDRSI